jgi:hypothetical protein
MDQGVRVAVADDDQVGVVGFASAGEHGVGLLAGFVAGEHAVHGVGGDALGGVGGGRVAEFDGLGDVIERQLDVASGLSVADVQTTPIVDVDDGPAVAILLPSRSG